VAILFLSFFPSLSSDVDGFKKLLEGYPEAIKKAVGLSIDSFATVPGYYSYIFSYVVLCGAIQAMNLGLSSVSKETREKTADFLLTKPVTRIDVITAKLFAILTSIVITNVVFIIAAILMASFVSTESINMKLFLMISITMFFIQLMFMSLGILLGVIIPKIRSVISVSLGTVFSFYIITMLYSVIDSDWLRYISPFKYFDTEYIIKNASYETPFMIIGIIFVTVSIGLSYYIYSKKDIHAV
jgi:ABC-2 type transport system permease protein